MTAQKPRKRGRPIVITPELQDKLLTLITGGTTLREACRKLKIHHSTVARKEITEDVFATLVARARVAGAALCLDEAEDGLRKAKPADVMRARELASHLRWKASKLLPLYADRLDLQATVEEKRGPVDILEVGRRLAYVLHAADIASRVQRQLPAPADQPSAELHGVSTPAPRPTHTLTPSPAEDPAQTARVFENEVDRDIRQKDAAQPIAPARYRPRWQRS